MSVQSAAVLPAPRAALDVVSAAVPEPAADEILVRVRAVAINPVDWVIQGTSRVTYRWLQTPAVLGSDVAGEVVAVGAAVTRFRIGQRVFGLATGTDKGRDPLREGAFQEYTILLERLAAPTPDALSDEEAAVFPLGVSTAACALFQPAHLGLRMPTGETPSEPGGVVVVWGGSTSVGMNAVQLARAAGYDVVSTASPRNAATVRSLGADAVVDYGSVTAVDELVAAIGGRPVAGAVALGAGSTDACIEVLRRTGGTRPGHGEHARIARRPRRPEAAVPRDAPRLHSDRSHHGAVDPARSARRHPGRIRVGHQPARRRGRPGPVGRDDPARPRRREPPPHAGAARRRGGSR
ncbi:zinc-binding alcohol dehydrogenase family protein [Microbacterium sp. SLBN-111]|uniref:zinc-binding alcohol dehydrogenase family protein n=1 Tax=Microbacterium sp. SLBN-111 TaxID=3377733 RepID=UPI003C7833B2